MELEHAPPPANKKIFQRPLKKHVQDNNIPNKSLLLSPNLICGGTK